MSRSIEDILKENGMEVEEFTEDFQEEWRVILKSVQQFVKEQCIEFVKYCETEAIRSGEDTWTHRSDNFKRQISTSGLYELFLIQSQPIQNSKSHDTPTL